MRLTLSLSPPDVSFGGRRKKGRRGRQHKGHATRLNAAGGVGSQMAGSVPSRKARREESKEFVRRGCDRALSASAVPSQSRELGGCRSISFILS